MPESELEVLLEALLSDLSNSRAESSASLSTGSSDSFEARFCRGSGTGATMMEPGLSSVAVSAVASCLGRGISAGEEADAGLGVSTEWSPSKLV